MQTNISSWGLKVCGTSWYFNETKFCNAIREQVYTKNSWHNPEVSNYIIFPLPMGIRINFYFNQFMVVEVLIQNFILIIYLWAIYENYFCHCFARGDLNMLFFYNLRDPDFRRSVACFPVTFHTPITPALGLCEKTSFNRKLSDCLLASIILSYGRSRV